MQAKNWETWTIVEGCFENSLYLSSQQWGKKTSESFSALIFNRWNCQTRVEEPCLVLENSNLDLGVFGLRVCDVVRSLETWERWQNSKHAKSRSPRKELLLLLKIDSKFQSRESRKTLCGMVGCIISSQKWIWCQVLKMPYIWLCSLYTPGYCSPKCGFGVLLWQNILLHGFCTLSGKIVYLQCHSYLEMKTPRKYWKMRSESLHWIIAKKCGTESSIVVVKGNASFSGEKTLLILLTPSLFR